MSSGIGWLMISLKKSSLSSILLSHSVLSVGPLGVPPEHSVLAGDQRHSRWRRTVLIFVDQRDGATKEPVHLVAEPGLLPPSTAAVAVDILVFCMNLESELPQDQHTGLGSHGLGRRPRLARGAEGCRRGAC